MLRFIAMAVLILAPAPAAFFIGRSVYYNLLHSWHLPLGVLNVIVAIISGLVIEFSGILAAHTALAMARWNKHPHVKKDKSPWQQAPVWQAWACFGGYAVVAICLAVVLEALPVLAVYAPALLTVMAAISYVSVGLYEQHRDRLAYYGLPWSWIQKAKEKDVGGAVDTPRQAEVKARPSPVVLFDNQEAFFAFMDEGAWPEGEPLTGQAVADMAGRAPSTGRRWIQAYRSDGRGKL